MDSLIGSVIPANASEFNVFLILFAAFVATLFTVFTTLVTAFDAASVTFFAVLLIASGILGMEADINEPVFFGRFFEALLTIFIAVLFAFFASPFKLILLDESIDYDNLLLFIIIIKYRILKLKALFYRTISSTRVNVLSLLCRGTYTSRVGGIRRTAALRLHLVILEHKQAIRAGLKLGSQQRLVRGISAPRAATAAGRYTDTIKWADRFILVRAHTGRSRVFQEVIHKTLA
jgi:hypothetical protein